MNAHQIVDLLALRHAEDIFVRECKSGPSQGTTHVRLDAWAHRKSWSHPTAFGYEVKVSRSDFQRDEKWPSYLPLCHQLYFVCPQNIIRPDEVPAEVGLMWCNENRVWIKRKAAHRQVTLPENLLLYVLMCRASIGPEPVDQAATWRAWLEKTADERALGGAVARAMGKHRKKLEEESRERLKRAEHIEATYARISPMLQRLGIRTWERDEQIERRILEVAQPAASRSAATLRQISRQLEALAGQVEQVGNLQETET